MPSLWIVALALHGAVAGERPHTAPVETAPIQSPIQSFIEAHGMSSLGDASVVTFGFRGAQFQLTRDKGLFRYVRTTSNDGHTVQDVLTNTGFQHLRDGVMVTLPANEASARSNSVNSVVYFATLPLPLADPAVLATQLPPQTIDGRLHERLSVRFAKEGGGDDHDDEYLYWFDAETKHLRFVAYRFHVGEGGVRFRVASNERVVHGVVFFDYDNLSYVDHDVPLADLPALREPSNGRPGLQWLSEIVLDDVDVKHLGR